MRQVTEGDDLAIARLHSEGRTASEIAGQLGLGLSTLYRRLRGLGLEANRKPRCTARTIVCDGCRQQVTVRSNSAKRCPDCSKQRLKDLDAAKRQGHPTEACSTPNCERGRYARGLCLYHYNAQRDQTARNAATAEKEKALLALIPIVPKGKKKKKRDRTAYMREWRRANGKAARRRAYENRKHRLALANEAAALDTFILSLFADEEEA